MKVIKNVRLYNPVQKFARNQLYHIKIENGMFTAIEKGLYSGDAETVIDMENKVLCPSFTDTHLHLLRYGLMKNKLDLREADSWEAAKKAISDSSEKGKLNEGEWIVAHGLMDNTYNDLAGLLNAEHLDEIENERPMFILHKDGHECVVNSVALEKFRKDDDISSVNEKFIEKNSAGNWSGRFKDVATHYIKFNFRTKNETEIDDALRDAKPFLAQKGITSVHTDDLNFAGTYAKVWKSYRRLENEGELSFRAFLHHYVFNIDDMYYYLKHSEHRTGDGSEKVRVGAFKIFVDGTHRLHTAAMERPFHDKPDETGVLLYAQQELNDMLQLAEENQMQVAMHCLGDRAVKTALNAIAHTENMMRHRIIHAQTLSDELLNKMSKVQPCIEIQPGFLLSEWNEYAKWLGEKRGGYCGMAKSIENTGAHFTLSSDAPIGPLDPFKNIFAAVNRTDFSGNPEGGWMPDEKLDVDTAFEHYTSTPAYFEFTEGKKGLIKEGNAADFIILENFPDSYSNSELKGIDVQQTWMNGKPIFERNAEQHLE